MSGKSQNCFGITYIFVYTYSDGPNTASTGTSEVCVFFCLQINQLNQITNSKNDSFLIQ